MGHIAGSALAGGGATGSGDFKADGSVPMTNDLDFNNNAAKDVDEINLVPKTSSSGARGTVYFDSDDDHLWVGTNL
jgi:hypothetical protein